MIINYSYDSSVTGLNTSGDAAYNPALYAAFTAAVQTAIRYFDTTFTSPITVNIAFGWGEVNGSAIAPGISGQSSSYQYEVGYSTLYSALAATDTTTAVQLSAIASLPQTDPTNGALFAISTAEAAALGLYGPAADVGGFVGLDSSTATDWSWTQTAVAPNTLDAVGTLEHEISEVLGRVASGGAGGSYSTLDLFRYTAADGGASGSSVGQRDEPFVAGYDGNASSYFSYNGTTVTQPFETPGDVAGGADVADWAPSVPKDAFADGGYDGADPVTATDLQEMQVLGYEVACFLPGTQIATPLGEVAVERLAVGDQVLTCRGKARIITWIGRGHAVTPAGRRHAATPVIVRKGALADNVPNRDLRVTKGHCIYIDDVLVPAEFLVNHRSILWDDRAREVTTYHLELALHDVLLANGAAAESYRDDGNRGLFQNANSGGDQRPKPPCAPVLTGGPTVDEMWLRLLKRSGQRPGLPLTPEPGLHLLVDQRQVVGRRRPDGVHVFWLAGPPGSVCPGSVCPGSVHFGSVRPGSVRIVSRAAAQDELGLARDPRVLGVAVRRIVLWQGQRANVIEADDPRLRNGFHGYEADNGYRWTDGDAEVPAEFFSGVSGPCTLDIYIAGTVRYPLLQDDLPDAA